MEAPLQARFLYPWGLDAGAEGQGYGAREEIACSAQSPKFSLFRAFGLPILGTTRANQGGQG